MKRISWICLAGFISLLIIVGLLTIHSGVIAVAEESNQTESKMMPVLPFRVLSAAERSLIAGNTRFAFELYRILHQEGGNLFFSPYSISVALAMVYAGAHGTTAEEMAHALHFLLSMDRLPLVFGALNAELVARGEGAVIKQGEAFQLRLANSLWAQKAFEFHQTFLDTLRAQFGAPLRRVNFADTPAVSRWMINWWVSRQTNGKIRELLPERAIGPLTRLMLANAVTFSATWKHQFEAFAASLTATRVASILAQLDTQLVQVYMPRFEFGSSLELFAALRALGMRRAFVLGTADFTGMADTRELFLDEIHHQTLVSVDEIGTFAAVATSPGLVGPDVPTMRLNRPFIFLIRDIETNTILFIGQVLDPSAG